MRPNLLQLCFIGASAVLAGCSLLSDDAGQPVPATVERTDPSLGLVGEHLQMMRRLSQESPAGQAEMLRSVRNDFELAPTPLNQLRYALTLATPGHGGADTAMARQQLAAILATPGTLLPAERALAIVVLENIEQRLILQAENERLRQEAAELQRQRTSANDKRLQTALDENARLRKALDEAQAKLDEIARIERTITERTPGRIENP